MKEPVLKYIFFSVAAVILFLMLITSRDAGINCDEVLHYNHSLSVYDYFATHGRDQSALNTPDTHLKYYGQSFDNLVTILIKWFGIEDAYSFRHLMSSLAGWLVIFVTAFFVVWLAGYRAGIIALLLFAASPTFLGHAHNNLKDIPFALAYISGIFLILKFLTAQGKIRFTIILLLTASLAFSLSIRAGGVLLICYLWFFFFVFYLLKYFTYRKIDLGEIRTRLMWIAGITVVSWFAGILLWPYALQRPVANVIESYRVMAHFPDTFRQIFEGKVEWSDYMPWYYLIKSMAITIPLLIPAGVLSFTIFSLQIFREGKLILYGMIGFTILFPLVFVVFEKSNLYSSWRQFLFLYPVIVLLAAVGYNHLLKKLKGKYLILFSVIVFALLSVHPVTFMIRNHPYYYLYYNQLVGGLRGAYSNYETDYYYVSQTEASRWLIDYLSSRNIEGPVKVKATYSVDWQFRNYPAIENSYFRFEERSLHDWDYAIVVNRYIPPFQLRNKIWPPDNAIHTIYVDSVPVCVVMERRTKDDYLGYNALNEGNNADAIKYFEKALLINDKDEMIFYNFAVALYNEGRFYEADSVLKRGLEINPGFEPLLMYQGNIAGVNNRAEEAIMYYERLIEVNRKYFEAYVALSGLLVESDLMRARSLLRSCLTINPHYKPAIIALADTYRDTNPDIAKKYDELASLIN
jgi:tetratricopeptide (TPR) repeat protein